jgi:hypothetical protein
MRQKKEKKDSTIHIRTKDKSKEMHDKERQNFDKIKLSFFSQNFWGRKGRFFLNFFYFKFLTQDLERGLP